LAFLRPGDGFILKVDHTGGINEIYVDWKTKAGGPIKKESERKRVLSWFALSVIALGLFGNVVWRVTPFLNHAAVKDLPTGIYILFSMMVGLFIALILGLMAGAGEWIAKRYFPSPAKARRAKDVFSSISLNQKDAARPEG